MTQVTRLTLGSDGNLGREQMQLSDGAGNSEIPLQTVGQDLRAAREARGDDLAAVSKVLKIRKEHLEAMEADRIETLPGRTYAVGFIRSYAAYLGLDPVLYVDRFKTEIAGRGDAAPPREDEDVCEDGKKLPQGWWILAVVVLLLICYGAYQLLVVSDRHLREQSVAEPMPVAPATEPSGAVPQTAAVPAPSAEENAAPVKNQIQTPKPAASDGTTTAVTSPSAEEEINPGHMVYGQRNKNFRIVLKAVLPTRVNVVGPDGTVYIGRMMYPGDVYRMPNLPGLSLSADDAGALQVTLDGKRAGTVGGVGLAAEEVSMDPDAILARRARR